MRIPSPLHVLRTALKNSLPPRRPRRPPTPRFPPSLFRNSTTTSSSPNSTIFCETSTNPTNGGRPSPPSPFVFVPSHSLFAKRPPRPFPPPFNTPIPSSFTDPLTTTPSFTLRGYTRPSPPTEGASFLSGLTNGDDAILATPTHLAVADGVGAWNTRSHGHAALWSRLMLHFWSKEVARGRFGIRGELADGVDPVQCLQEAYKATIAATRGTGKQGGHGKEDGVEADEEEEEGHHDWEGTTTTTCAVLKGDKLLLTNLGDSVGFVYRPNSTEWLARTEEQWHWFDCPRQLGTNSPDTPADQAVVTEVAVQDGDLVLLATDGLVDNAWDEEILTTIQEVLGLSEEEIEKEGNGEGRGDRGRMAVLADRLVEQARKTACDPFAESPYMQRSIEEGLGLEGGKFDDISVVVGVVRDRKEVLGSDGWRP